MKKFTVDMLLINAILSGCDYIPSIKGIGFKTAHWLVAKYNSDFSAILK